MSRSGLTGEGGGAVRRAAAGDGGMVLAARTGLQECRGQANLFGAEFGPLVLIKCGGFSKTSHLHKQRKK